MFAFISLQINDIEIKMILQKLSILFYKHNKMLKLKLPWLIVPSN